MLPTHSSATSDDWDRMVSSALSIPDAVPDSIIGGVNAVIRKNTNVVNTVHDIPGTTYTYSTKSYSYNKAIPVMPQGIGNYTGLFRDSDFDLNPQVQEMVQYYDDLYLYADIAYENGIIDYYEYTGLKAQSRYNVDDLRRTNKVSEIQDPLLLEAIGGFIPYAGVLFDVLGDPSKVQAASYSGAAMSKISQPANLSAIRRAIDAKNLLIGRKYTVYELVDPITQEVKYVGRTRQSLTAREGQHWNDPLKNGLIIRPVEYEGKTLKGLTHSEARGLERLLFQHHGGFDNPNLLNRIGALDIDNPKIAGKAAEYIKDALKF